MQQHGGKVTVAGGQGNLNKPFTTDISSTVEQQNLSHGMAAAAVYSVIFTFSGVGASVTSAQSSAPGGQQMCSPVWAGWLGPCQPRLHSCKGGQDERLCSLLTLESPRPVGEPAGKDLYRASDQQHARYHSVVFGRARRFVGREIDPQLCGPRSMSLTCFVQQHA